MMKMKKKKTSLKSKATLRARCQKTNGIVLTIRSSTDSRLFISPKSSLWVQFVWSFDMKLTLYLHCCQRKPTDSTIFIPLFWATQILKQNHLSSCLGNTGIHPDLFCRGFNNHYRMIRISVSVKPHSSSFCLNAIFLVRVLALNPRLIGQLFGFELFVFTWKRSRFVAVMHGPDERTIPGNAVAVQGDMPFRALQRYGMAFLVLQSPLHFVICHLNG